MSRTDVVVIGAGQAGLAISWHLAASGIDHVVLERRRVAERWRSERWDSLRLLTPNWMTRLPGWRYRGPDPDGFMTMAGVTAFLDAYARSFAAPVRTGTEVLAVARQGDGWRVETDRGMWSARAVVVATGHCDAPLIPEIAWRLPTSVEQLVPGDYRNPRQLLSGGVLVVGASASGVQIADELARAGRAVTLAVGRHIRLPRRHRGRDIFWWLDRLGLLDQAAAAMPDIEAARSQPSLQLVGSPEHRSIDLATLSRAGVRLAGRVVGAEGGRICFAGDLADTTAAAERKLTGLRARIDSFAEASGLGGPAEASEPLDPAALAEAPRALDLSAEGIGTVVWATGFRRRYPWLPAEALDHRGEIRHRGGVGAAPGLYVLGLRFMRRRKSGFIDGVGGDAGALAGHLIHHLSHQPGAELRAAV
ncbi:MAG TPA: NAD(P)-binding domain-containing protein [Thermohalobaculum sp.]|nr:NAD(P)-binding domain-containing protein [Thermohalobaculum sp.]